MRAKLRNILTGQVVDVRSTTEHPDSSYGKPVWVDADGTAYFQVDTPNPLYEVSDVEVSDRYDIGLYLRYLRLGKGVTVRELADGVGYSPSTVINVEKGKFSPNTKILMNLLDALDAKMILKLDE
jgi:DNA-binding XRE family transcriptional regulator